MNFLLNNIAYPDLCVSIYLYRILKIFLYTRTANTAMIDRSVTKRWLYVHI